MKKTYMTPEMAICNIEMANLPICASPQTSENPASQGAGMDAQMRFTEEFEGAGAEATEDLW